MVIDVNGEGKYNEVKIDANVALSAYGKDGFKGYLKGIEQKNENVMYINQKRTQELLKGEGLQLPARLSKLMFNSIIHRIDDFVNIKAKIDSKTPNQNIEIKYGDSKKSIKMGDAERQNEILKKVNAQLNKSYLELKNGKKSADTRRIARIVREILDDNGFAYDRDRLTEQFEGLTEDALAIKDGKMDFETFREKVKEVARAVVDEGTRSDSAAYQESKAVRDYLRTTAISLGEADRNNLGDEYETIRKGTFGRLRLVKENGTPIDVAYRELSELFPEYFSTETEVGASAQLRQIVNVLDGLQSLKTTPFSGYENEASEWLSGMMIDRIFNEIFVSGRTGKVEVSVDMKALRESMGDNLQRIMNRERSWRTREYEKLQKQFEKKTKSYTEARQKAIKVRQVKLHTERLSKALLNPSERFAVPEFLKAPVAKFLSCIDVSSDRMSEKTREMLGDLMKAYKAISEQEYELSAVVDPSLYDKLDEISEEIATLETENKKLTDLSLETLEKLRTAVMAMEASVRNYNKAFREGKAMQIDMLATAAAEEIQQRMKGNKANSKIYGVKQLSDLMNFEMMNPWDYFHQMGGTFEELFMGLRQGENKQIRNLARAKENMTELRKSFGINPQKISGKNAERTTFRLSNGDEVDFTKAQVMSLYLLWRQNASHEHILEGGFRPGKGEERIFKKKDGKVIIETKHYERYTSYRPSLEDVGKIIESLSENEKKFAEGISRFFTEECAEWGNEVALQLYGYKKFATPDYFPIVSDRMSIQEEFGVSVDSTIKNMGCTQKRIKHANNPVIIEDIFDVYARHTSDMAKYNAYVLPLQDIQRVFNHVSRGDFGAVAEVPDANANEVVRLVDVLRKNQEKIEKSGTLFDVRSDKLVKAETPTKTILNYFKSIGNRAKNTVLGEVEFTNRGAKSTVFHGISDKKVSAILAVKDVVEKGKIIAVEKNWKGRGYDTYTIAAKGLFDGEPSIVGVIVKNYPKDNFNNKFYLHEIIKIEDPTDVSKFNSQTRVSDTAVDMNTEYIEVSSDVSVPQKNSSVNNGLREGESLKALIASKYGEKAIEYFSKLMSDINGGIKVDYNSELANGMVSKYKRAKMGANLRVVIQQPVSYLRAAVLIDSKYLAKANGHKVDIEKVFKYSPIAQWKDWGFFSIDTGMSMKSLLTGAESKLDEISEKSMWAASKADQATWKKLWAAVELETADLHPELNRGSEAFYEACGRRFDEIIDRTQVVDSTLHRSQILRSKNDLVKGKKNGLYSL